MSGAPIYRGYDQAALDAQYFVRGRVPDFQAHFDAFAQGSAETRAALRGHLGLSYGDGPSEALDIFVPPNAAGAPVEVFFHGGYWQLFSKDDYSFVARPFVAAGAVAVIVDYALVPKVDFATLLDQCRRSVEWVQANISAYGPDPSRIYLSGHSAGGHIAALLGCTLPGIRGVCALSGLYDLEPIRLSYLNQVLGLGADDVRHCSPLLLQPAPEIDWILAYGALESEEFARQADSFAEHLRATAAAPRVEAAPDHNHITIVGAFGRPGDPVAGLALGQMGLATPR